MNKRSVRAFSLGILFSATIVLTSPMFMKESSSMEAHQAITILEEQGYMVMTKEDYNKTVLETQDNEHNPKKETPKVVETDDNEAASEEDKEQDVRIKSYQLVVEGGMNTREIAELLQQKEIIGNREEFEQYLIDHDYNTKVQVGSFELNSEMNFEEISKIITKSKK